MSWSYAWAVEPGNGKAVSQDAVICRPVRDGFVLAVADGAGSAARGGEGAKIVCDIFSNHAHVFWEARSPDEGEMIGKVMWKRFLANIDVAAGKDGRQALATTFLGALFCPWGFFLFHLGDGAAVIRQGSCLKVVSKAAETEFVNVTRFVTDANALDHLKFEWIQEPIDEICLMTDGLQPLVVDDRTGEPHAPFFEKVFQALSPQEGFDERAAGWLSNMLKGDSVKKRTDDDTTIVLAKRNP